MNETEWQTRVKEILKTLPNKYHDDVYVELIAAITKATAELVIAQQIGIQRKDGTEPSDEMMDDIRFITENLRMAQRRAIGIKEGADETR